MSPSPRIAIIGGGPGGLLLARVLALHSVPSTIYEREPSRLSRSQGGSLDLHPDSGLAAMRAAGLLDEFMKKARPEGDQLRIYDSRAVLLLDDNGPPAPPSDEEGVHGKPEIDRSDLRDILLDSLAEGTVQWGSDLVSVTRGVGTGATEYTLDFKDGRSARADILVGADGAWSRVRLLLTPTLPLYSGISFIDLSISDVDASHPSLSSLVGPGLSFFLSSGRGLIAQRNSHSRIRVYVTLRVPESFFSSPSSIALYSGSDIAETRSAILSHFEGWSEQILDLVRACDEGEGMVVPRKIYYLPTPFEWQGDGPVSLIGDAAHVMSPFAGEGVNLALRDAKELATAIVEGLKQETGVETELRKFEREMLGRAEKAATESMTNLELIFSDKAPMSMVERMNAYHSMGPPPS